VARIARHRSAPGCLDPGTLYHVTNRGVDRRDLFRSDFDRVIFLAMLALACVEDGLKIHAFCLMPNHFHLLVEDPCGMLSRLMLRLQSAYARYFNNSRGRRGSGHLFGDRFFCEVVDSARYYDEVTSYILLNPLRCRTPLAIDAASYRWSSAALHLSAPSVSEFCWSMVEACGGVEAVMAAMPRASHPQVEQRRRERFAALLSGAWIERDAARCERTPTEMREVLKARRGMKRPLTSGETSEKAIHDRSGRSAGSDKAAVRRLEQVPRVTSRFVGREVQEVVSVVTETVAAFLPSFGNEGAPRELGTYLLWRFTSAAAERIGSVVGAAAKDVMTCVEAVRERRQWDRALEALLWRAEWWTRWRLRSAPWRA
jgi:REP element-mobilizing transposase RayT